MPRLMRHRRRTDAAPAEEPPAPPFVPRDLGAFFTPPAWFRDFGTSAWLAVGVALFVVGIVWLLSLTQTIVLPVITAGVVAAVASPLVRWLAARRLGRGAAAGLVLVGLVLAVVGMVLLILGGLTSQSSDLSSHLNGAKDEFGKALHSLGVDQQKVDAAKQNLASSVSKALPDLLHGVVTGLKSFSSLVFFLSLTALSLFFLLMDGPHIRAWAERHMRVPAPVAHQMTGRVLESLRGYFFGVTIVAAFNAVVIGLGAVVLGVPLAGTIAIVTFIGAYIPYLGAWSAGFFAVAIALGGAGTSAAIGMAIIALLGNGVLQQLVQPFAYGAALGIHPLAVLIVTIAGGALFGAVGLILAAPLTAAATKISADLAAARPEQEAEAPAPPPAPPPEPALGV